MRRDKEELAAALSSREVESGTNRTMSILSTAFVNL